MTEDMRPSHFVGKMKKYRKRLANEMKYMIKDKQFMLDILAKLPKGSDDKALGPYQIQRRMIVKDIENAAAAGSAYDIEDMVRDLDRVYVTDRLIRVIHISSRGIFWRATSSF